MPDIIQLLPDHIANQIAAGEVIQRPASAVKEMLENAIDAGATQIHLIIRDAGKELIQVNDNGKGMSPLDARLCFERHATSKIRNIDDLFAIRTMGFRGEALASIAAVAQVELRSRTADEEVGTCILIDHSTVRSQEPCPTPKGTSLQVKNLFYNVPARRNFLKSNTAETRHIIEEFTRVAMAFPELSFRFTNNQTEVFNLDSGKLKHRILGLLGQHLQSKLVPVEEPTDVVSIRGFVGSPEAATKTRGNQYFFVNNRFIRSAYLNHAVSQAFRDLIGKDEYPLFVLFIDIDPGRVDINVHPTKQEIKFEDERIVYSFVNSAVKHALSKYSIAPSLDFTLNPEIEGLKAVTQPFTEETRERTQQDFLFQSFTDRGRAHLLDSNRDLRQWRELYKVQQDIQFPAAPPKTGETASTEGTEQSLPLSEEPFRQEFMQIGPSHMVATTRSGCMLVDIALAHQRVLYEEFSRAKTQPLPIQRCLHPQTMELPPSDAVVLKGLLPDLLPLGFEIEEFGTHTFIIQGTAPDIPQGREKQSVEQILEAWKHEASELRLDNRERLVRVLATQKSIPAGRKLSLPEMEDLFGRLLRCEQPQYCPKGRRVFVKLHTNDLHRLIQHHA
jgi:DNA mismatch repair protein MutL